MRKQEWRSLAEFGKAPDRANREEPLWKKQPRDRQGRPEDKAEQAF